MIYIKKMCGCTFTCLQLWHLILPYEAAGHNHREQKEDNHAQCSPFYLHLADWLFLATETLKKKYHHVSNKEWHTNFTSMISLFLKNIFCLKTNENSWKLSQTAATGQIISLTKGGENALDVSYCYVIVLLQMSKIHNLIFCKIHRGDTFRIAST